MESSGITKIFEIDFTYRVDLVALPIAIGMVEHPVLIGRASRLESSGITKIFEIDFTYRVDLVAQLVEHNTFNVGALGSSPSGIT